MSDVERLQQILINLIGNALKFTVKGHVEFGYEIEKKEILFYVEDTGIGIPKEKQDTVFDRFMQADNTLTRKFGGSGLGLAISKGLVELLDGKIWCESVPDKGSTFYFTIPYRPANLLISSETTDNNDDLFTSNWKQYHILVVEDDAVNGKIIEAMLKPSKVKLALADSGPVAIDYVKRHRNIDLILMDVHLPEMNGLEAAKIILNQHPGMRIIAQTANAMSNDKDKCIEAGCVDYISKPFDMKNLLAKIAKHLPEKPNG
jgi:CheY-like chemotaxis protein